MITRRVPETNADLNDTIIISDVLKRLNGRRF